jgi:hypothetical protein
MSDATVSRLGQVNVTGAVDALFLEVWSGEVLEAFNKKQTTADKHLVRTIANGKSAQFPILGTVGSAFHVAGTELSFQQVKHAKRSIAIDGLLVAPIFLDVLDEAQNHYDVRAPYQEQQGQTLANDWDQRVLRSFIIASRTATHPNTALPGGRRVTSATMGTSSSVLKSSIYTAAQYLDENNVEKDSRYVWVAPAQFYLLLADGEFINRDFAGEGSKARANVPFASDLQVIKSNNLPRAVDTSNTDLPSDLRADYSANIAIVGHKSAAGTVRLIGMTTEGAYDINRQGWIMVSKYAQGTNYLRPDAAVELATA